MPTGPEFKTQRMPEMEGNQFDREMRASCDFAVPFAMCSKSL